MKRKTIRKASIIFAFLAVTASFTSCNRGYGCPTNFSIGDTVVEVIQDTAQAFFKL